MRHLLQDVLPVRPNSCIRKTDLNIRKDDFSCPLWMYIVAARVFLYMCFNK